MIGIGLFNPKCDANVGGVLRAAECYGVDYISIQGNRSGVTSVTNTYKSHRRIPVVCTDDLYSTVPYGCIPIGVDLVEGAESLVYFKHPKNAFYIFGSEDGTLGKRILDKVKYVVMVPTKGCMNLAASVNVIMYDRMSKYDTTP